MGLLVLRHIHYPRIIMLASPRRKASSIGSFSPITRSDGGFGEQGTFFHAVRVLSTESYPFFVTQQSGGSSAKAASGSQSLLRPVPSFPQTFPTIFQCVPSKEDPHVIVCEKRITVRASPIAAAALAAHFGAAGSARSLHHPPLGTAKTVMDAVVVDARLNVTAVRVEVVLRETNARLGMRQDLARVRDLLGGDTLICVTRCKDGRPLFCPRINETIEALAQAGVLWTVQVGHDTAAALVFPVSLETQILIGRGTTSYMFGNAQTVAVHNLDAAYAPVIDDACSPALGVPVTMEPDRAALVDDLIGRGWTEHTRQKALGIVGHHVQDPSAWRRYCAFLQTMEEKQKYVELCVLADALMTGFSYVDARAAKCVADRSG